MVPRRGLLLRKQLKVEAGLRGVEKRQSGNGSRRQLVHILFPADKTILSYNNECRFVYYI